MKKEKHICTKTGKILYKKIYYYGSGEVRCEYYYFNDKQHREDGPASIYYYESGEVSSEHYYLNDKVHREDGPAYIYYYKSGEVESEGLTRIHCDRLCQGCRELATLAVSTTTAATSNHEG